MAEPDESKVGREQELSVGPGEEGAATSGPAFEEPPAPKSNVTLAPGDGNRNRAGISGGSRLQTKGVPRRSYRA